MLHQVLAVESEVEGEANKIIDEANMTFTKRAHHFNGHHKRLVMFDEARQEEAMAAEERLLEVLDKMGVPAHRLGVMASEKAAEAEEADGD